MRVEPCDVESLIEVVSNFSGYFIMILSITELICPNVVLCQTWIIDFDMSPDTEIAVDS